MTTSAHVATARRPAGLVVETAGHALVLYQAGMPTAALTRLAAALPQVPETVTAVLAGDPGFDRAGWSEVVTALRAQRRREVLLMRGTVDPIRAQKLADWLESDVLIPSGRVLTVPDGSLFVVKPGRAGYWERYRPGTPTAEQTGPWYPEPSWSHLIPPTFMLTGNEIVTNLIPGGMWLRRPAGQVVSVGHIIYSMPPGPDPVLLVWSPGAKRPLRTEEVADMIASLPPALQEGMAMLSYDVNMDNSLPMPRSVAHYLGKPIRQQTGLRLADASGRTAVVATELAKGPTWRPFAETLVHPPQPSRQPELRGVRAPAANLTATGPGVFAVTDAWSVEVTAAGLWLRPAECDARRPQARLLPADPVACTLVIGVEDQDLPRTVWSALELLVDGLPPDALRCLRLVLGDHVGREGRRQLKDFANGYSPPLRVERLSVSGLKRRSSLRQSWRDLLRRPLSPPRRASAAPAVGVVAVAGATVAGAGPASAAPGTPDPAPAVSPDHARPQPQTLQLQAAQHQAAQPRAARVRAGASQGVPDTAPPSWERIPGGLRFAADAEPRPERPALAQLADSPTVFVVEAAVRPGGFAVGGALLDGAALAARIAAFPGYAGQPVLLLPPDTYPGDIAQCDAIGDLARELDVRVTCSERPLWLVDDALFSADPFLSWEPRAAGPTEEGFLFPQVKPSATVPAGHAVDEPPPQAAGLTGPAVDPSRPMAQAGVPVQVGAPVRVPSPAGGTSPARSVPAAPATGTPPALVDSASAVANGTPAALRVPEWIAQPAENLPAANPPQAAVAAGRDHRSSPGERSRLRGLLGWRYDSHARMVARLLAERPGLRHGPDDELVDDLIALCEFLNTDPAPYQAALRTGDDRGIDPALVSCAAGALRRLPALRSPVLCGGPDADDSRYQPGAVLTERGIIGATTEAGAVLDTPVEYLIWSVTARRVGGMADATRSAEVAFPAGTRMRVLDRVQAAGTTRVLLADDMISEADDVRDRILRELRAFSQRRDDTAPVALNDAARGRLILRIGLTPAGDPQILPRTR